ncbi:MAG TPA: extracellular solute-binding protein [Actinomycetota bacterium]|jgi:spermidine/putrescine-binding protein|nr:extracellular solute-binding protein [Actinomycetota bacterium]
MRRRLVVLVFVMGLVAAACSSGGDEEPTQGGTSEGPPTGTVTLFGYEDNFVPEVIDPFLEANPDLDVRTAVFGSNDEAVTKLQNGFQADVINVCTEETGRMVDLGLLQPIDTSRIEAWDTLFPSLKDQEGVMVDGEVYMIPNVGGTSGIIYNPEEVPQGVDSYRDLFEDPALAGEVTLEDSATTVIAITALALGHEDPFALTEDDLTEIKDYLIEHKSAIRALFKGDADFLSLYRTGEIIAGFGYHDYRAAMTREGIPVEFVPGEGSLAWICGMSLSANAQNVDAAYAAMNHYISPQTQSFYAESYTYLVSDQRTLDVLKPALVEELGLDDPTQLDAAIALQLPDNYDQWLDVYREFKAA